MTAKQPVITTRAQWGANPLVIPASPISLPSQELWLHHTAGEQFDEAGMRLLQAFALHRTDAHYVDLEYTLIVDHVDCRIFESRGVGFNTAATGGWRLWPLPPRRHNSISHAICVMGNFEIDEPSAQLIETLANLVAWGHEKGWWPLGFTGGHRDASGNSTACPGNKLEAKIPQINARATEIHRTGVVAPPVLTQKAKPMFNPPFVVVGGVAAVAVFPDGKGWIIVGKFGHIYAAEGYAHGGPYGAAYWGSREVAEVHAQGVRPVNVPDAGKPWVPAGYHYTVLSTDVKTYSY